MTRTEAETEEFNERAGILEFDAGMTREEAERIAAEEMEAHRLECEARMVANLPSNEDRAEFLNKVAKHRGPEAAKALRLATYREIKRREVLSNGKA